MKAKIHWLLLITAVAGGLILAGCGNQLTIKRDNQTGDVVVKTETQPGQVAVIDSNIIIAKPLSGDQITSPIEVSGRAKVSEGKVVIRLRDAFENVMATTTALTGESAENWGFYKVNFDFPVSRTPYGWLEVFSIGPQDNSERNLISLPIFFAGYQNPTVKVFFSNIKEDPNLLDCSKVYPVSREINFDVQPLAGAIAELLRGLTDQDVNSGFVTNIPEEGVKVQSVSAQEGIITIDFNQALQEGVGGSCRVTAIRSQITETLKQFEGVKDVIISIDGKAQDILQP
ncbi:MAG: Gmad2 immunoglobulin-like domain-containing protein [Patescibacteria group bacterium]|jgi:hypothetical protein|nr:Gmad2 immunoglobulin-like domain-containing protein [Patescibacteria group bacterium]